ncbi:2OG-Fe(II) oxygenase [Neptunicella marina]|uniref:2OG-Fe(II) oxygenase n=1 Tax=Neptunicella marina TaxID=2125989 RepID=A0A8J6M0W3_9ALTE|nr:2OG-Fe(II) oxygenase [Neptunicella marina]MBC3767765.1 2OG-Fe(II) oxygenase [Neptunicella marina]
MSAVALADYLPTDTEFDFIADQLVDHGYCVLDNYFPAPLITSLAMQVRELHDNEFSQASIGRELQQQRNEFVRTDSIKWLDSSTQEQQHYLRLMNQLKTELNRRLFMGLFDFESHFAHYKPGDFYKRHLDAFKGQTNRVLSSVLYLNPGWQVEDGGELLMYERRQKQPFLKIVPNLGRLVLFLSERFPHEVLSGEKDRYSVTGWFRVNNSVGGNIDPSR